MKTKTLLIAAAALAAGVMSSQAQVYSQNIVGYVNTVTTGVNQWTLLANPLDSGTNNLTGLFPSAPNQTQVEIWNGTGFQLATKQFGNWTTNLNIPVGTGFFIKYPSAAGVVTNTFVGSVYADQVGANGGGTNVTSLPVTFVMVGSKFPVGGSLTNAGDGTLNLGPVLVNASQVETWQGTSFQLATKQFGNWTTNLPIAVGQGMFIKAKTATNWVQTLNP